MSCVCVFVWHTFSSLMRLHMGRNSSRLCLEHTEYTSMNACPFVMDSRCIAGNWCEPVVSVICNVQIFLLQLITCKSNQNKKKIIRSFRVYSHQIDYVIIHRISVQKNNKNTTPTWPQHIRSSNITHPFEK